MELHNFYGFLTPGGFSYSCSRIPSPPASRAMELRDWEGGKFPNKQTLREGLSLARQWKEPDSKFLVKEEVVMLPIPLAQGHGPREAGSGGHRGWLCCIPNQFSSHTGVTVSSGWMPCQGQQQGERVQGQSRHPGHRDGTRAPGEGWQDIISGCSL